MNFAAVLAGGVGSRMNHSDVPKQFLMLGDKPIIIRTIEKFATCQKIDFVYVGVQSTWLLHTEKLVAEYLAAFKDKIRFEAGGNDRNSTLMNVINKIEADFGVDEKNNIITHDAVRPFVTERIINDNIAALKACEACATFIAAVDTIVESADGLTIARIPERKYMYQAQTPQSFRISLIKRLYSGLAESEKTDLTDACKICVLNNSPVRMIAGDQANFKITTVNDYKTAQAMLENSKKD